MAEKHPPSVYTSTYTDTDSLQSERDFAEPYDIALLYSTNSNLNEPVSKAKIALQGRGFVVRDSSDHDMIAGRLKAQAHIEETIPAKYRIVIFNVAYKKHELPVHAPMLYSRATTTKKNTLIVLRKKHMKHLPEELRDLGCHELENVTGSELAEIIIRFVLSKGPNLDSAVERYEEHYAMFQDIIDNFDSRRSFILVANVSHPVSSCIRHLARVHWLKVFDFDHETKDQGLLSIVKPYMTPGKFAITSSDDPPRSPSDDHTDWTTWTLSERESNNEIAVDAHVKSLFQYCYGRKVATLIILWYPRDDGLDFDLFELVQDIKSAFRSNRGIKCVLFTPQIPSDTTALNRVVKSSNRDDARFIVPLTVFSEWIRRECKSEDDDSEELRLLPSYQRNPGDEPTVSLSQRIYNWLSSVMDVLTFYSEEKEQSHDSVAKGIDFLQGGTISWETLEDGTFDGKRAMMNDVLEYIKNEHIKQGISGAVYIHHHPGSGGTTLGRKILWKMRKTVPCMALHPPIEDTEEFREKIKFVRNHTKHISLLLVDGKADVEKMLTALSYEKVVILNIVRHYGSMENKRNSNGHFYLKDELTKNESKSIFPIYSRFGHHSCEELRQRPADQRTYVYEYGLTAFTENFFGVRGYVRGHLKLEEKWEPWHYVIAFLALSLHYGQQMLPCEMFSSLLPTKRNNIVKKTAIPFHGRRLIKEDGDKWSITYSEVAREVLKQLLTKDGDLGPTHTTTLNLKGNACNELKNLATSFILEMRGDLTESDLIPRHKLLILREVFILRNEERNVKYAMLLQDVDRNEYRGDILRKLVECFPQHADFHAHLGRYYGKSGITDKAEKSFKEAIQVRMDELHGRLQDCDEVLQRIHHMFGYFYFNTIPSSLAATGEITEDDIMHIIGVANKAIKQFEESRKYFILGTNPTFGFLGEVKVRLRVVKITKDLHLLNLRSGDVASHFLKLKELALQSFGMCDHLLAQCVEQATEHELQSSEFRYCTNSLMQVFQDILPSLDQWAKRSSTLSSQLCQIAALKQKLTARGKRFSVFFVKKTEDLEKLLKLYEVIIDGTSDDRKRISSEMLDWLKIIRRIKKCNYSLQTALDYVDAWDRRNERNSLSTYYSYVLNVVLAISFPGESMSQIYRKNAEKLREKLETSERSLARHVLFRSHEWLANDRTTTIDALVHRDMLGPNFPREIDSYDRTLLRRCTGTITIIKGWFGYLFLDGFSDPVIKVFFTPQQYGLTSQHAAENLRAEFYLGFNPRNGAEAFDIVILETRVCPCGQVTEVRNSSNSKEVCSVCRRPFASERFQ